ncbi:MAG: rhomboid family intramembrane serine protease [Bacteroidaceae bacterium]|nr:rhomboid family intramembrane serine protease [Bacteroidaceae bacterium]
MNHMPAATKHLLIVNVLAFFASYVLQRYGVNLNELFGLHFFLAPDFHFYQLFTYLFLHQSFPHLFFNMFAVWMFGRILEQIWGSKRYLIYYVICGVGAGLCQELVQYIEFVSEFSAFSSVRMNDIVISMGEYLNYWNTVGASGAVYGILLAFGMTFPNQEMFIFPLPMPIKAKYFVIGYAVIELLEGISNRPGDNIAHFAHLGGMLFGLILILYWRKKNRDYERFYY